MSAFALHPRLEADTAFVADWTLSRVLLMNDARYRWLILVPCRAGLVELYDLSADDRAELVEEIARAGRMLKALTGAAKINTGALGNMVPQLHVHVLARNPGDPAWPGPVWGHSPAEPYRDTDRDAFITQLVNAR
ncbi:MAG: HIT domain-containing protein [Proteobacteria bacterium]|nr:HIT domain-containing protein [Pseudomonadota bacterium]